MINPKTIPVKLTINKRLWYIGDITALVMEQRTNGPFAFNCSGKVPFVFWSPNILDGSFRDYFKVYYD